MMVFVVAGAAGFEPATCGFGDRCSNQLSYAPAGSYNSSRRAAAMRMPGEALRSWLYHTLYRASTGSRPPYASRPGLSVDKQRVLAPFTMKGTAPLRET